MAWTQSDLDALKEAYATGTLLVRMPDGREVRYPTGEALLHKSGDGRGSPFPGQTHPTTSVTGMPRAVKPFRTATLTWNSAT